MVPVIPEEQQQKTFASQEEKGRVEDTATFCEQNTFPHCMCTGLDSFVPQIAVQPTFCYLSIDERLPGGLAVGASSHLISSHVQTQTLCLHVTHDVTRSRVAQDV